MKKFLKILAVAVALVGGLFGAVSTYLLIAISLGSTKIGLSRLGPTLMLLSLFFLVFFACLGFLMVARAIRHLRRPDRGSANEVVGFAAFMVVLQVLSALNNKHLAVGFLQSLGPVWQTVSTFAALIAFLLFFRLVLARVGALAYPDQAAPVGSN